MRRTIRLLYSLGVMAATVGADVPGRAGEDAAPPAAARGKTPGGSSSAARARPRAAASPDPRATSLFRSAQNLEKAGKQAGAVGLYRDVLIRYPASPEASDAAARIKALGGRLPTASEIRPAPPAEKARYTRAPRRKYASQAANRAALEQMIGDAMSQPAPTGGSNSPY